MKPCPIVSMFPNSLYARLQRDGIQGALARIAKNAGLTVEELTADPVPHGTPHTAPDAQPPQL